MRLAPPAALDELRRDSPRLLDALVALDAAAAGGGLLQELGAQRGRRVVAAFGGGGGAGSGGGEEQEEEQLLGYVAYQPSALAVQIVRLAVASGARRRGVGRALLQVGGGCGCREGSPLGAARPALLCFSRQVDSRQGKGAVIVTSARERVTNETAPPPPQTRPARPPSPPPPPRGAACRAPCCTWPPPTRPRWRCTAPAASRSTLSCRITTRPARMPSAWRSSWGHRGPFPPPQTRAEPGVERGGETQLEARSATRRRRHSQGTAAAVQAAREQGTGSPAKGRAHRPRPSRSGARGR